jgi:hypothetical protein
VRYLLLSLLVLAGCAIPVRPIAKIVKDSETVSHYERDAAREPQVPAGLLDLARGLCNAAGPWGQLLALLVPTSIGAEVVRRKRKKNKKAHTHVVLPKVD